MRQRKPIGSHQMKRLSSRLSHNLLYSCENLRRNAQNFTQSNASVASNTSNAGNAVQLSPARFFLQISVAPLSMLCMGFFEEWTRITAVRDFSFKLPCFIAKTGNFASISWNNLAQSQFLSTNRLKPCTERRTQPGATRYKPEIGGSNCWVTRRLRATSWLCSHHPGQKASILSY